MGRQFGIVDRYTFGDRVEVIDLQKGLFFAGVVLAHEPPGKVHVKFDAGPLAAVGVAFVRLAFSRPEGRIYCSCATPTMDVEHDAACRLCGLPVNFAGGDDAAV